ncbi:MAG TPA: o-succinylbenzoate--CoA ligase [Ktedonosporobacter sp.]|nr:o-succinylbenzoate--CoA ligase [Ktedonosporobacter sp.]
MTTTETVLPDWLARCAQHFPSHLALQYGPTRWTFSDLEQQVTRLALQLASAGVGEGSRIALLAASGLQYVTCVHALTRLGAILVPLNTRLSQQELCWQVGDVRASLLVHDEQYAPVAAQIVRAVPELVCATLADHAQDAELVLRALPLASVPLRAFIDLAATQVIMYTSGTTGQPKGVIITYGMQWWSAIGSALNLGHSPDDCWLACMPLFHIGGLAILMRSVIYGISIILQEKFDALAVNRAICEERVTIISVVAVMLQRMLAELDERGMAHYPTSLRCVLLGGGPAPLPLLEECARRNVPVVQTYGLTESCSQAVTLAPTDSLRKLGSAGRPLLPVQLRIMQDERPDLPAPIGEPGVIYLKGPNITPGYVDRPEATAQAIKDGWLSTGDIGYLDEDGYLYVLDRRSDLIISGGENVYPAQIEAVLLAHPDVEEAGACGIPDQQWGQVPIAFVRLRARSTASSDDLFSFATQRLARYKLPRAIYIVDALPRNGAGKLVRRDLPRLLPF